jgi:hypothetical protein
MAYYMDGNTNASHIMLILYNGSDVSRVDYVVPMHWIWQWTSGVIFIHYLYKLIKIKQIRFGNTMVRLLHVHLNMKMMQRWFSFVLD